MVLVKTCTLLWCSFCSHALRHLSVLLFKYPNQQHTPAVRNLPLASFLLFDDHAPECVSRLSANSTRGSFVVWYRRPRPGPFCPHHCQRGLFRSAQPSKFCSWLFFFPPSIKIFHCHELHKILQRRSEASATDSDVQAHASGGNCENPCERRPGTRRRQRCITWRSSF